MSITNQSPILAVALLVWQDVDLASLQRQLETAILWLQEPHVAEGDPGAGAQPHHGQHVPGTVTSFMSRHVNTIHFHSF